MQLLPTLCPTGPLTMPSDMSQPRSARLLQDVPLFSPGSHIVSRPAPRHTLLPVENNTSCGYPLKDMPSSILVYPTVASGSLISQVPITPSAQWMTSPQ